MSVEEIRDAIHQLPDEDKRELIIQLVPEFAKQFREDPVLRERVIGILKEKTKTQSQEWASKASELSSKTKVHGQELASKASEKVSDVRRVIQGRLATRE